MWKQNMVHGIMWNLILANSTFSHAKNYFHIWTNWTFFYLFVFYKRLAFFRNFPQKKCIVSHVNSNFHILNFFIFIGKYVISVFFHPHFFWAVAQEDKSPFLIHLPEIWPYRFYIHTGKHSSISTTAHQFKGLEPT